MRRSRPVTCESLEPRRLFSSSTILQDEQQLKVDQVKLNTDRSALNQTLSNDQKAIAAARQGDNGTVASLEDQLRSAILAGRSTEISDRADIRSVRTSDESAIAAELAQIRTDAGNPTALAADHIQLATDRAKLTSDVNLATQTLSIDTSAANAQIASDQQAIVSARANATAGVATAQAQLASDRAAGLETIASDQQAIVADKQKLAEDKKATT